MPPKRMASWAMLIALLVLSACDQDPEKAREPRVEELPAKSAKPDKNKALAGVSGWLNWRGPGQQGVSLESPLPDAWEVGGKNHLWTFELAGRGTPVLAGGRLYAFGYQGEGAELREVLACLDAETGKPVWLHRFNDFLSDIIYSRYSIGSPTVDRETGNVYLLTSPGLFCCFSPKGQLLWQHSMMEENGRLTFPNGRTGAPVIDGALVIVHGITSNWGGQGPARDRFYAYEKSSGHAVWMGTTNVLMKDNSMSTPYLAWQGDRRVFYCGTGDGSVACFDVPTGSLLWNYRIGQGGVNASVVVHHRDKVIAIQNTECVDTSQIGRMVAIQIPREVPAKPELDKSCELWRNDLGAFSSSPVLVGDRLYQTVETGDLVAVDANTGKTLWKLKLGLEQLHASPLYADGKLYVPIKAGDFYIVKPGETEGTVLSHVKLEGECIGAPSAWNGKVYVFSTKNLYCFGRKGSGKGKEHAPVEEPPPAPVADRAQLQALPAEVLLRPGQTLPIGLRWSSGSQPLPVLNSSGPEAPKWVSFIPPTAKVQSRLNAQFPDIRTLVAASDPVPSAGMFELDVGGKKVYLRGRILPDLPLKEDFESFEVKVAHETETAVKFAYPPLPWIGARFKWEVRERDGNKVLAKTIDNKLFQRAQTFIGHPDMKNYTIEADVLSEGNRRKMSEVGLINQRYCILLKGNAQEMEVSSNYERLRVSVPFAWPPNVWYHLKARVDLDPSGHAQVGMIRAKAWKKGDPEPEAWTIEVPHDHPHQSGSPGFFGLSPTEMRVYIDNIAVTPNEKAK